MLPLQPIRKFGLTAFINRYSLCKSRPKRIFCHSAIKIVANLFAYLGYTMKLSTEIDWQIESMRATVFTSDPLDSLTIQSWFTNISAGSSSRMNISPNSFQGAANFAAGLLRVNSVSNRLDVILSPDLSQNVQSIGSLSTARDLLTKFMLPLKDLGGSQQVDRVAYAIILNFQVQNEEEGLALLAKLLTRVELSPASRDLLYRVNIPVPSKSLPGISLNRLATWCVAQVQILQVKPNSDAPGILLNLNPDKPFSIRLEMDLSTDSQKQLSSSSVVIEKLLHELSDIAAQIALHGESVLSG